MGAFLDFLGWDSLSYAEQTAVVFYATIGGIGGFLLAMWLLATFGFNPRRVPEPSPRPKAKAKPKGKARAKPRKRRR